MNDIYKKLCDLFNHIKKAHKHAAAATKTLRELHEDLPLDVFLRIADATIRPLVILYIPKTEVLKFGPDRIVILSAAMRSNKDVVFTTLFW